MSFSIATRLPRSILSSAYGFGAFIGVFSCFSDVFFWSLVGEELELEPALTATDELELESTFAAADELELESTFELDLEPAFVSDELELELAFAAAARAS